LKRQILARSQRDLQTLTVFSPPTVRTFSSSTTASFHTSKLKPLSDILPFSFAFWRIRRKTASSLEVQLAVFLSVFVISTGWES
jgi:hypothetical protein